MLATLEKQKVIELYNSFIDNLKKENFNNGDLSITYKGILKGIGFRNQDIAHYFEVVDLVFKPQYTYIVVAWLFFDDTKSKLTFTVEGVFENGVFTSFLDSLNIESFIDKDLLPTITKELLDEFYESDGIPSRILAEGSSIMEHYFYNFLTSELIW